MRILMVASGFSPQHSDWVNNAPERTLAAALEVEGHEVVGVGHESRRASRGFDVCHIHHRAAASVWRVLEPRWLRHSPVVFTGHSYLAFSRASQLHSSGELRSLIGLRVFQRLADGVVALSNAERRTIAESSVSAVIPNAISRDYHVGDDVIRQRPSQPSGVLFIGQLKRSKGVFELLDAYSRLEPGAAGPLTLVFHNRESEREVRARAGELGILSRTRFVGKLTGPAIREELLGHAVLALPSHGESLPSVIYEAMLAGTPVVASHVGGVPEQIGEFGALVPAFDVSALERALGEVTTARYSSLRGIEMSHFAAQKTDPRIVARAHLEFYATVIDQAKSMGSRRKPRVVEGPGAGR